MEEIAFTQWELRTSRQQQPMNLTLLGGGFESLRVLRIIRFF